MSDDTTAGRPSADGPGPSFATPGQPSGQPSGPYGAPPAAYGQGRPAPEVAQDHVWTADGLVSTPALPPERVGRGAALALLAVPLGALVAGVLWKIGFVGWITGFVLAAGAGALYLRGSGGRIRKGIPVIVAVIALGIVASFFTIVAVDVYDVWPQVDPDVAATYAGRWDFVRQNLFYPPVLKDYTKDGVLLAVFGILGALVTIVRLVRMRAQSA